MSSVYGLIELVKCTTGAQQDSWKGELHRLVMRDIYACIDAASLPFGVQIERQETMSATIQLLLNMVPSGIKEERER